MSRERILVVDDQAGMLHAVERVLAPAYEVRCVASPSAALDALGSFTPDLALLDVRLPEMSGFVLMDRLKVLRPDLDVLFMTGSVNELDTQLIRAIAAGAFYFIQKPFDRQVLLTLVERCLTLRRLATENRRHTLRLERELAQARIFQHRLLPPPAAQLGGLAIDALYLSCTELCGDFYDYTATRPDRIAVVVADVSGHGVSAAMLTGMVKSAFQSAAAEQFEPRAVVNRLLEGLRAFGPRPFVTAFAARISHGRPSTIEYCNAGHPPALLGAPGRPPRQLESTGPLICSALGGEVWEAAQETFGEAERLLLYTDGLIEIDGPSGHFGIPRLADAFATCRLHGAPLLEELARQASAHALDRPRHDDQTLLTISTATPPQLATSGAAPRA